MSFEAFRWAKSWGGLSTSRKFVLLMLADHYNEEAHRAWPSMQTLARETGMSRRSVVNCIATLEKEGLIEVEQWVDATTGKQMSNRYCLPWHDEESVRAETLPVRVYRTRSGSGWEAASDSTTDGLWISSARESEAV
ncbi:helix-turn-helix domain-containing protein [Leifsonia sp. Le1]|uniref:helix-turn-helix domain-containing protein n=1 Tax=Leifsonia sp. Le1 TaxID=3404918 RepID=UPI003EB6BE00